MKLLDAGFRRHDDSADFMINSKLSFHTWLISHFFLLPSTLLTPISREQGEKQPVPFSDGALFHKALNVFSVPLKMSSAIFFKSAMKLFSSTEDNR